MEIQDFLLDFVQAKRNFQCIDSLKIRPSLFCVLIHKIRNSRRLLFDLGNICSGCFNFFRNIGKFFCHLFIAGFKITNHLLV